MRSTTILSAGLALAGLSTAAPVLEARQGKTAAALIGEIAPASLSCADATECRTNEQAAPFLVEAMAKYSLYAPGQVAAVLALTAFESVNYSFKHNVSPGRPGQGTSNMQMIDYNVEYAASIPELADQVAAVGDVAASDDGKNKLLALVTDDKYNFGSGPWFLTTQCPDVVDQLAAGTDAAFAAYMQCVGVSVTPDRQEYWNRAKTAFGL